MRDRSKELEAKLASARSGRRWRKRRSTPATSVCASWPRQGEQARSKVDELNAAVAALREQLAKIAAALDFSEAKVKEQQTQIADLGKRLNLALANKVQELARYRSEFFGRLREIIGDRPDIRIVGDRFVFQSEVLFAPGSADFGDAAKRAARPCHRRAEGDRRQDPERPELGAAGRRPYRPAADQQRAIRRRTGNCRRRARSRSCAT